MNQAEQRETGDEEEALLRRERTNAEGSKARVPGLALKKKKKNGGGWGSRILFYFAV